MSLKTFPVWVGSLSVITDEKKLRREFERFGPINSVALQREKSTGVSRQFAFVNFHNKEVGDTAAREMNGNFIDGSRIKAKGPTQLEGESKLGKKQQREKIDFRPLTDCSYFIAGEQCNPKNGGICPYRHLNIAKLNTKDCPRWKEKTCRNIQCNFRHPGGKVHRCSSHNMVQCQGECGTKDCNLHFDDTASFKKHAANKGKYTSLNTGPSSACSECGAVFFSEKEKNVHVKKSHKDTKEIASSSQDTGDLEPVGVFWDIENCPVPSGKSALAIVNRIRKQFYNGRKEAEFKCVCDTSKEKKEVIDALNKAHVDVLHVSATAKNAADDKLKQALRRFALEHQPPATVILISGDINFSPDLSDLMHRNKFTVILIHNAQASDALKECADQLERFEILSANLPLQKQLGGTQVFKEVLIGNLPRHMNDGSIKSKLSLLGSNCGGKVTDVRLASSGLFKEAIVQFPDSEAAKKAKKRLEKEIIEGLPISTELLLRGPKTNKEGQGAKDFPAAAVRDKEPKKATPKKQAVVHPKTVKPNVSATSAKTTLSIRPAIPANVVRQSANDRPMPYASNFCPFPPPSNVELLNNIDLVVKNFPETLSEKELKGKLESLFREQCKVNSVTIIRQEKGTPYAYIRVPRLADAQLCVSKINGKELLGQRLSVTLANEESLIKLKREVANILLQTNSGWLPLDNFVECYRSRNSSPLNMHKLDLLKELIYIDGKPGRQFICLLCFEVGKLKVKDETGKLSEILGRTVMEHDRKMPAASLPGLYWSYTNGFLPLADNGVPLLNIACRSPLIEWIQGPPQRQAIFFKKSNTHRGLQTRKETLKSEIVKLLEASPGYKVLFSQFFIAFYEFYGRKFTTDYGPTTLDVLDSIKHIVEVDGKDDTKVVSLRESYRKYLLNTKMEEMLRSRGTLPFHKILPCFYQFYGRKLVPKNYGFANLPALVRGLPGQFKKKGKEGKQVLVLGKTKTGQKNVSKARKTEQEIFGLIQSSGTTFIDLTRLFEEYYRHYGRQMDLPSLDDDSLRKYLNSCKTLQVTDVDGTTTVKARVPRAKRHMQLEKDVISALECGDQPFVTVENFLTLLHEKTGNNALTLTELADVIEPFAVVLGFESAQLLMKKQALTQVNEDYLVRSLAIKHLLTCKELTAPYADVFEVVKDEAERVGATVTDDLFMGVVQQRGGQWFKVSTKPTASLQVKPTAAIQWLAFHLSSVLEPNVMLGPSSLLELLGDVVGVAINPDHFGFKSVEEMVGAFPPNWIQLTEQNGIKAVTTMMMIQVEKEISSLLQELGGYCYLCQFAPLYQKKYNKECKAGNYGFGKMTQLMQHIPESVLLVGSGVRVTVVLKKLVILLSTSRAGQLESVGSDSGTDKADTASVLSDEDDVIVEEESEWSSINDLVAAGAEGDLLSFSDNEGSVEDWWMSPVPESLPEPVFGVDSGASGVDLMSFISFSGKDIESAGLPTSSQLANSDNIESDILSFDPVISKQDHEVIVSGEALESQNPMDQIQDLIPLMHHDVSQFPLPDDDFDDEEDEVISKPDSQETVSEDDTEEDVSKEACDERKRDELLHGDFSGLISMLKMDVKVPRIAALFPSQEKKVEE